MVVSSSPTVAGIEAKVIGQLIIAEQAIRNRITPETLAVSTSTPSRAFGDKLR